MTPPPGVYQRGQWLWIRWTDAQGLRRYRNSKFKVGEESKAAATLEIIKRRMQAERDMLASGGSGDVPPPSSRGLTIEAYWTMRLKRRQRDPATAAAAKANVWHGRDYILPLVGHYLLAEFRPRHAHAFVVELKAMKREDGEPALAPRTLHTVWHALRGMFRSAVVDELLAANPCVLERGHLPKKKDRDPNWRRTAVFGREEVELLISHDSIPLQRRVLYALLFLAGLRPGEASALRWSAYDTSWEPLGLLDIQRAYDTDGRMEKETKTEQQRLVPVHPTLASVLARWRLAGWAAHLGRTPKPEDLVVPNQQNTYQSGNGMRNRAMDDLKALGWRKRRFYDTRRTFISRCQADTIPKDIYRWWTHGPPPGHDAVDLYASVDWPAHCREMLKLKISLREGVVMKFAASIASNRDSHWYSPTQLPETTKEFDVGARGFEAPTRVSLTSSRTSNPAEMLGLPNASTPPEPPDFGTTVSVYHPPGGLPLSEEQLRDIGLVLRVAATEWAESPDVGRLHESLSSILDVLSKVRGSP